MHKTWIGNGSWVRMSRAQAVREPGTLGVTLLITRLGHVVRVTADNPPRYDVLDGTEAAQAVQVAALPPDQLTWPVGDPPTGEGEL